MPSDEQLSRDRRTKPAHAASASIVIPIRIRVTGPTLEDCDALKQSVIKSLREDAELNLSLGPHTLHHRGLNRTQVIVHEIQIGD